MSTGNRSGKTGYEGSAWIEVLSLTGVVGPVLFWIVLLVVELLYPGGYAWKYSVSTLVLGPYGWLQTANFYFLTVFTTAFGVAVYLGIARSISGRIGSILMVVMGIAQLLTAIFPVDLNPSSQGSQMYVFHKAAVIAGAGSYPVGALLVTIDLRSSRSWRRYVYLTLAAAGAVLCLDAVWLASRFLMPSLVDSWFGIYERILLGIPLFWMAVISVKLFLLNRRR